MKLTAIEVGMCDPADIDFMRYPTIKPTLKCFFFFCHWSHLHAMSSRFVYVKPGPDSVQSKFITAGRDISGPPSRSLLTRASIEL